MGVNKSQIYESIRLNFSLTLSSLCCKVPEGQPSFECAWLGHSPTCLHLQCSCSQWRAEGSALVKDKFWSSCWRRHEGGEELLCGQEVCGGEGDWLEERYGCVEKGKAGSGPWQQQSVKPHWWHCQDMAGVLPIDIQVTAWREKGKQQRLYWIISHCCLCPAVASISMLMQKACPGRTDKRKMYWRETLWRPCPESWADLL